MQCLNLLGGLHCKLKFTRLLCANYESQGRFMFRISIGFQPKHSSHDKVQSKAIHLINNPNLTKSLQPLSHRRLVGDLSIYYRYFNGHCSQEIRDIIPVPLRRVRTTRSSTHSHPFQVSLPNPRTLSHKSSFIPRTCNLWNISPSSCFPESYNLPSFKSNVNKLDLISLSS